MWNDLPAKFKCLKSTNLFKREIKMYLAHRYMPSLIQLVLGVMLLL